MVGHAEEVALRPPLWSQVSVGLAANLPPRQCAGGDGVGVGWEWEVEVGTCCACALPPSSRPSLTHFLSGMMGVFAGPP